MKLTRETFVIYPPAYTYCIYIYIYVYTLACTEQRTLYISQIYMKDFFSSKYYKIFNFIFLAHFVAFLLCYAFAKNNDFIASLYLKTFFIYTNIFFI